MIGPRRPARLAGVACLLIGFGACGDAGTELGTPPTELVAISMAIDTIGTSESTDPPLSVRVLDALGSPIEGTPVRFLVATGEGTVVPPIAISSRDGVAESRFEATGSPGEALIRADVPSAPNVPPLDFRVIAQAADSVLLQLAEGDAQRAEIGSQLPVPFAVRALTPSSTPAGGIAIAFRIVSGGRSAVLTADTVVTGADGLARTLLTLGRDAGDYEVSAFATRGVHSDTTSFHAAATSTFEGTVLLDSLASSTGLVAGEEAVLHGYGFSPIAAENDVRIEGESATVIDATGTRLTIQVPTFTGQCLPMREVGVRVLVQGDASNGSMLTLYPAEPMVELDVGASITVRSADAVQCLQFGSGDGPGEYTLALASSDRRADQAMSVHLTTRVPSEASAPGFATSLVVPDVDPGVAQEIASRHRPDAELRSNVLADLIESRTPVARSPGQTSAPVIPVLGDALQLNFAARPDLTATCSQPGSPVTATVRGVGEHLILAEDDAAPGGGFGPDDWTALLEDLDGVVAPTDTAYFGPYADLDGNDRVIVLFTSRVNALVPPGQGAIGGFFLPLDLAAIETTGVTATGGPGCPASNQGEVLYLALPDPEGDAGPAVSVERALRTAGAVVAHELQHLINAQRRVLTGDGGFAAAEEPWLDEALSGIAEEVSGLAVLEQPLRARLTHDQLTGSRDEAEAFESFHQNNFFNLGLYMSAPSPAPMLAGDPTDSSEDLRRRGFGWILLRWLGDRAGGDERVLFRQLVAGGRNGAHGVENVEQAAARTWGSLLGELAVVLAEDSGSEETDRDPALLTWDLRDVFAALNGSTGSARLFPARHPLAATPLASETGTVAFDVGASTMRFFSVRTGPDAPAVALAFSTPTGTRLSDTSEPQITIVRIR